MGLHSADHLVNQIAIQSQSRCHTLFLTHSLASKV